MTETIGPIYTDLARQANELKAELDAVLGERDEARQQLAEEKVYVEQLRANLVKWRTANEDGWINDTRIRADAAESALKALQGACEQLKAWWRTEAEVMRKESYAHLDREQSGLLEESAGTADECADELEQILTAPPVPSETKPGKIGESMGLSENLIVVPSETTEEPLVVGSEASGYVAACLTCGHIEDHPALPPARSVAQEAEGSCHCPAVKGEDCPLTDWECAARYDASLEPATPPPALLTLRQQLTDFLSRERALLTQCGGQSVGYAPSITPSVLNMLERMLCSPDVICEHDATLLALVTRWEAKAAAMERRSAMGRALANIIKRCAAELLAELEKRT